MNIQEFRQKLILSIVDNEIRHGRVENIFDMMWISGIYESVDNIVEWEELKMSTESIPLNSIVEVDGRKFKCIEVDRNMDTDFCSICDCGNIKNCDAKVSCKPHKRLDMKRTIYKELKSENYIPELSYPISKRVQKFLYNNKIFTLEKLSSVTRSELASKTNCGIKTFKEIEELLAKYGLKLKD